VFLPLNRNHVLVGYEMLDCVQGSQQIQIEAIAAFLKMFGAHMSILFIFKLKVNVLIKWSYKFPQ